MTEQNALPGADAYEGALYALPETNEAEVLTELEFHALKANGHHHERERHECWALLHAIEAGRELRVARSKVVKKRGDGTWEPWVEENFDGHIDTARDYMRVSAKAEELGLETEPGGPLAQMSLVEFRRVYLPPKPKELEAASQETSESEPAPEPAPEPDPEPDKPDYEAEIRRLEAEREKAEARAREALEKEKTAKKRARQAKEREKQATETLEETRERWAREYTEELARLHAKYGIDPEPSVSDLFDGATAAEELRGAVHEAADKRLDEAVELVIKISGLYAAGMREYLPGEAARAITEHMSWRDPRDVNAEIARVRQWIDEFADALVEQIRPGVRAIK